MESMCPLTTVSHLMGIGHVQRYTLAGIIFDGWDIGQEALGHTDEGIRWPPMEPVKLSAVHQSWELTSTHSELVPHWAEAQHHMQILPNLQQARTGHFTSLTSFCTLGAL
jgi:hypothetical protein